jgi:hypothetical protein
MDRHVVDVEGMWGRSKAENSDEGRRQWRGDDMDNLDRHKKERGSVSTRRWERENERHTVSGMDMHVIYILDRQ